jgi:lipid-A-disaccharide synthase-like uncharacterized protein
MSSFIARIEEDEHSRDTLHWECMKMGSAITLAFCLVAVDDAMNVLVYVCVCS